MNFDKFMDLNFFMKLKRVSEIEIVHEFQNFHAL